MYGRKQNCVLRTAYCRATLEVFRWPVSQWSLKRLVVESPVAEIQSGYFVSPFLPVLSSVGITTTGVYHTLIPQKMNSKSGHVSSEAIEEN